MKYIDKSSIPVPKVLTTKGAEATTKDMDVYAVDPNHEFQFDPQIYRDKTVKDILKRLQKNTCCFCEAKVTQVAYGAVEHFRPKGGFQKAKGEPLQKPGYFWLAYDWDNLLFTCQICNSSYKKNLFPLVDETQRAHNQAFSIMHEKPVIINPSMEDPSLHISFHKEIPYGKTYRGKETIQLLGLDRNEGLNEDRLEKLTKMKAMEEIATLVDNQVAYQYFKNTLINCITNGEYTLMYKTNFNKHL
jgi:uncharacterized protein (TIGR02646 family)